MRVEIVKAKKSSEDTVRMTLKELSETNDSIGISTSEYKYMLCLTGIGATRVFSFVRPMRNRHDCIWMQSYSLISLLTEVNKDFYIFSTQRELLEWILKG